MKKAAGFTLIEILVVMVILGGILFMAVPKFKDFTDVNIKSTSRNLSGTIKYLYNESVFKKNIYKLAFDLDNNEYWVEYMQDNQFVVSTDPILKRKRLPDGIFFEDIFTERTQQKIDSGNEAFILFLPNGFVDYAVIHINSSGDDSYTIETKPYTGGTKIYDQYYELRQSDDPYQTNKLQPS
ncbi:MAG: pilus assembly FimT family protein [Thermodesulfobacteriota bacterium]